MAVAENLHLGQLVHHRLGGYRGVIVDVNPEFRINKNDMTYWQESAGTQ